MSFGEGNLHERVERLEEANRYLCSEVNRQQERIDDLEELVRDLWPRASFTMAAVNRHSWRERLAELGIEVGE